VLHFTFESAEAISLRMGDETKRWMAKLAAVRVALFLRGGDPAQLVYDDWLSCHQFGWVPQFAQLWANMQQTWQLESRQL
jgi:hypothetical protein